MMHLNLCEVPYLQNAVSWLKSFLSDCSWCFNSLGPFHPAVLDLPVGGIGRRLRGIDLDGSVHVATVDP